MSGMTKAGVGLAGLVPHPPIIVPEVGGVEVAAAGKTVEALERLGRRVKEFNPDALVMITPHGMVFENVVAIYREKVLAGNLGPFGAAEVAMRWHNHPALADAVAEEARRLGVEVARPDRETARSYAFPPGLDHGLLVPLYYLKKAGVDCPLVPVAMAFLPFPRLYAFGLAVHRAAEALGKRVALLASGDLSHRLRRGAPAGYDPRGKVFDRQLVEALGKGDVRAIMGLDPELTERAGECGLRPLIMMLGSLEGRRVQAEVLSYEGPFGVGYAVALLEPGEPDPGRELLSGPEPAAAREESFPVRLARSSLEAYVREGKVIKPPADLPPELRARAGVFVSLKKYGNLRGCIGTVTPVRPTVAEEIIENAIGAGTRDPRFPPVEADELEDLDISVDVLTEPQRVESYKELDPQRYGVIVRKGAASGLLLPALEGIDNVHQQVVLAKQKAGIPWNDDDVELYRFEVKRYT